MYDGMYRKAMCTVSKQGRIYGEGAGGANPPPRDDLRFSNTTGILPPPKNYVVYWC